jgi:hypothetical protein
MVTPTNNNTIPPIDWRSSIVDQGGRPTPAFQRAWNSQRSINAAAGTVILGSGVPTVIPTADGSEYVDISTTPFTLYVGSDGSFHQTGVKIFTDLADVPHSYAGSSDLLLRVNSAGTGLEFIGISSVLDGIGSTEGDILYRSSGDWTALSPGTAGQVLTTGGPGANPTWAAGGGGGGGGHAYEAFGALPLASAFTAVNQQSSALSNSAFSLSVATPGVGGQPSTVWQQSAPSIPPWNVYMRIKSVVFDGRMGLCIRNNTTGNTLSTQADDGQFAVFQETITSGGSSFNTTVYMQPHNSSMPTWFRMQNDGINLISYVSHDGVSWDQISSSLIATWVGSADSIGISLAAPSSSANTLQGWVGSFGITAPS